MSHPINPGWVAGDYWMQCDLCGFHYRRSEMRERWDKAWVCHKDWEVRHPQELIRGIKERIDVPVARPDSVDFTNTTTLAAAAAKDATSITVASAASISDANSIGIETDVNIIDSDDKFTFWTTVNGAPSGVTVNLDDGLEFAASFGNTVYIIGDSFSAVRTTTSHL